MVAGRAINIIILKTFDADAAFRPASVLSDLVILSDDIVQVPA